MDVAWGAPACPAQLWDSSALEGPPSPSPSPERAKKAFSPAQRRSSGKGMGGALGPRGGVKRAPG